MIKRILLLLLMIGWDLSLHIVELLDMANQHILYPIFPLFNIITYDIFWVVFWAIAFIITLTLLKNNAHPLANQSRGFG